MGRWSQARRRGRGIPIAPTFEPPVFDTDYTAFGPNGSGNWEAEGICPFQDGLFLDVQATVSDNFDAPDYGATPATCDLNEDTGVPFISIKWRARWVNGSNEPLTDWGPVHSIEV
jgi:hypothetical protein